MDILDQARLLFVYKNEIEFYKKDTSELFMQVSKLTKEEEVQPTHVCDRQIRAELEEFISAYKAKKTESVDVSVETFLTNDTPPQSEKTYLSRSLRNTMSDVKDEKLATKQNVLWKLLFTRNGDAPDTSDLKYSVFW